MSDVIICLRCLSVGLAVFAFMDRRSSTTEFIVFAIKAWLLYNCDDKVVNFYLLCDCVILKQLWFYSIPKIFWPIERCHSISNLDFKALVWCASRWILNWRESLEILTQIWKSFENNPGLAENLEQSLCPAKSLVQTVLSRLSLKDKKIQPFEPANKG